jgi:glycosyltransferase involved in cell wall biosynthesis
MREPMRILHVFGRMARGGAELRTIELAESFRHEHVRSDFLVLSGLDGALDDRVRAAGGDVIKCPLDRGFPARLFRLLRAGQYDVVHSHVHFFSGVILAIARAAGTRGRIAHFRTTAGNDQRDSFRRRLQLAACRQLVQLAATDILAVCEGAMRDAWSEEWHSDARCRVVYNGIPLQRRQCPTLTLSSDPTIVNVASIQPLKNQLRLIGMLQKCVRRRADVQLLLVGREQGDYGETVRNAARDAGLTAHVHLIGEVEDAMPWIAGASVMVLPSLWEGLPGAVLEACAVGTPVLTSELPGARELARHFPGVSVRSLSDDDEAWAEAILTLIATGKPAARDTAERFPGSPFALSQSRQTLYDIWGRSRARA